MAAQPVPPVAPGKVLATLNTDGSRRWLNPRPSRGPWWRRRRALAYALIAFFVAMPYVRIHGAPAILLDLPRRHFTLFGATFLATDTLPFGLALLTIGLAVFLVTALVGRVWCGWACPQTVYLEFVFRPLDRWLDPRRPPGTPAERRAAGVRRIAKLVIQAVLAAFLAHVFLAYFVGVDALIRWVQRSPVEHPTPFLVMLGTAALVFLDFAWFREQTCLVACPYGRLQSVLLDRRSLVVGYDPVRGEPRAKGVKLRASSAGDCIDCRMCVTTCPTGIDIREGLQMECIHCTQCIDACDAVMAKIGRPPGLIRYSSTDALAGRGSPRLRPRIVVYPALLAIALGAMVWQLAIRPDADITLLRGIGAPYTLEPRGQVVNTIRIKILNRTRDPRRYLIALETPGARLIAPMNPLAVAGGATVAATVFVEAAPATFAGGSRPVRFRVSDGSGFDRALPYTLLGPESPGANR